MPLFAPPRGAGRSPHAAASSPPPDTGGRGARLLRAVRSRRGVTASEFTLVAVPATIMMYGIIEVAWQLAAAAALDHAALRASRFGITGAGAPPGRNGAPVCRSASIPWFASAVTGGMLKPENLTVTTNSFGNYASSVGQLGGTAGAGAGGQVASYTLVYRQPYLLGGLVELVAGATEMTYRATITVKNEPFNDETC
jgi:Flp pilus assembly protein TadG